MADGGKSGVKDEFKCRKCGNSGNRSFAMWHAANSEPYGEHVLYNAAADEEVIFTPATLKSDPQEGSPG
jgi:hypothetical protein